MIFKGWDGVRFDQIILLILKLQRMFGLSVYLDYFPFRSFKRIDKFWFSSPLSAFMKRKFFFFFFFFFSFSMEKPCD